jgi:hypothetical protein
MIRHSRTVVRYDGYVVEACNRFTYRAAENVAVGNVRNVLLLRRWFESDMMAQLSISDIPAAIAVGVARSVRLTANTKLFRSIICRRVDGRAARAMRLVSSLHASQRSWTRQQ